MFQCMNEAVSTVELFHSKGPCWEMNPLLANGFYVRTKGYLLDNYNSDAWNIFIFRAWCVRIIKAQEFDEFR